MTQSSIIICGMCDGRGYTERDELVDYHRREYDTIKTKCRLCGGSGRMRKVVRTEVTPFVPEEAA